MRSILPIVALTLVLAVPGRSQTDPSTLPAHDHHEGLLVAADPYTDIARSKEKFGKANPLVAGIIPIEVFLRNESDAAMRIDLETVVLEIAPPAGERQHLGWLDATQVAFLIVHPNGVASPREPARKRIGIGIPLPKKDKKTQDYAAILQPLMLDADVIPPLATLHGFLFFDLSHDTNVLANASLYIPDIKLLNGNKPLTYFEVDLRPAVRH